MPWILISKSSSLYLTPPPPLCVSHARLDWEAISAWLTTPPRPASCFSRRVIHTSCGGFLSKVVEILFFLIYLQQHILYVPSHAQIMCEEEEERKKNCNLTCSGSLRPRGFLRARTRCWQDISAGCCIGSHLSSETLSAPTLHYRKGPWGRCEGPL